MKNIKLFLAQKRKNKGQSLMEMTVVLFVLLLLLLGTVEFGNLLNQYISLVDGVRAGARAGSNGDPFVDPDTNVTDYSFVQPSFYDAIDGVIEGERTPQSPGAIGPLILVGKGEIMITILSLRGGVGNDKTLVKIGPKRIYNNPKYTTSQVVDTPIIQNSLQRDAPNTGLLVVEIFYDYDQLLKMPIFTAFIPDPIPVYTYAIMPLSAAEPTPVVKAKPSPIAQ